jgi:hypothetical protein
MTDTIKSAPLDAVQEAEPEEEDCYQLTPCARAAVAILEALPRLPGGAFADRVSVLTEIIIRETAAPDLLEACKEFVRKVDIGAARSTHSYNQMKAAIAKAEPQP